MGLPAFDRGSFRDRDGRVFLHHDKVYRTLESQEVVQRMEKLLKTQVYKELSRNRSLISTKIMDSKEAGIVEENVSSRILSHEKISNLSYPFEWSFLMLKDAALLTLTLQEKLLEEGFILKDGTAWNISFLDSVPCFFDILSIGEYQEGQPWEGFSQFLQEFLYPLMLQSYYGIDFQLYWRSTMQGIPVNVLAPMVSTTDLFSKKGLFKYVFLQSKLSQSKKISEASIRKDFSSSLFPKEALTRLIKNLKECVERLHPQVDASVWKDYATNNTYDDENARQKEAFIRDAMGALKPKSVIDLGCNTGVYSIIASEFTSVISCDLDPTCIDRLYAQKHEKVLPLVANLMNPSSQMGWFLEERKSFFERIQVESFMALALMHHICITYNVPLADFVRCLSEISSQGVVEWVDKKDPMVQFLLRNRKDIFEEYTQEHFERCLKERFKIKKTLTLNAGTRTLYLVEKK